MSTAFLSKFVRVGLLLAATFGISYPLLAIAENNQVSEIVVVVHESSKIQTLTAKEVKYLYLGRTPALPIKPIVIDYKPSHALRERFYKQATGTSLSYSVRAWATYAFSGRGFPPVLVSSQIEVERLLRNNPEQHIGYIEKANVRSDMRVVFAVVNK